MQPHDVLREGMAILDPVLAPYGFSALPLITGTGSGGAFARSGFVAGDRRLDLSHRSALGEVTYRVGDAEMTHDGYMRRLGAAAAGYRYPGFSTDALDGYRHLGYDLEHFCGAFLNGDRAAFQRLAAMPELRGFGRLGRT